MPKKNKRKPAEEEPASEAEAEPEPEPEPDEDQGDEDRGDEDVSDAEEGATDTSKRGRPSKKMSAEQREKSRASRRKSVAKRKGYRLRAIKGGYAAGRGSAAGSARDVASNVLTVAETIRACKWAPKYPSKPTYASLEEFKERTALAAEPLPPGAAAVIRASGEAFLRKAVDEAVLRSFEAGRPRVTVATLHSVLRPLMGSLRFSFAMPQGLLRHAQKTTINAGGADATAIGFFEDDEAQIREEAKLLPAQEAFYKETEANIAARKELRSGKKQKTKA
jgi:hypothetical protein